MREYAISFYLEDSLQKKLLKRQEKNSSPPAPVPCTPLPDNLGRAHQLYTSFSIYSVVLHLFMTPIKYLDGTVWCCEILWKHLRGLLKNQGGRKGFNQSFFEISNWPQISKPNFRGKNCLGNLQKNTQGNRKSENISGETRLPEPNC